MYQPRPPVLPATPKTSSAATTVRQPNAQADLRPLRIEGNAEGRRMSEVRRRPFTPRLRATIYVVGLIVRKPVSVFIATGHVVACATTKTIANGVSPNQIIARGKIAMDGNGLKIADSKVNISRPKVET